MAMTDFRMPTKEEQEIMLRNGIDPEGVSIKYRDEKMIHLIRHKTRDEITIRQGDRKW